MKKLSLAILLLAGIAVSASAQSTPPTKWVESDGSPSLNPPRTVIVPVGSISGSTVTLTGGGGSGCTPPGTANRVLYDNGAGGCTSAAGFLFNGTAKITLGVAGTSVGSVDFKNATSGTITLSPVTGALGTVTLSLPAATDTLVGRATTDTLTNKTLTTPTIGDFSNANHNHSNSAGGGQIAISSGISGLGTGVATALAVNVGSAGAFVTFDGAGGTPSSLTLTNATGLPPTTGISGWPANAAGVLTNNGSGALSWAAAGGGITIGTTTITSGTNTKVLFNNSGVVGEYTITGTGNVAMSASPTFTGTLAGAAFTASSTITQTSTSATAFTSGANGATNPTLTIDNSTASQASGITIAGKADGTAPTITVNSRTQQTNAIAGNGLAITADPAIAGSSSGTAAAGGSVTITAGAAARNTSGNANGGNITLTRGAGIGTGTTGQVLLAGGDGTATVPSLANSSSTNTGLYFPGSNQLGLVANGSVALTLSSASLTTLPGIAFNWNADLFLRRSAAANLAFGAADAASPVAQTLSVQNVVAGTSNTAGANWTLKGSASTGTGVGGDIIMQVTPAGTTGTSVNTFVSAFTVKGNGAVQLQSVTFANLPTVANGYLIYCSDCTLASPCASGGSGALAKGINGAWVCN